LADFFFAAQYAFILADRCALAARLIVLFAAFLLGFLAILLVSFFRSFAHLAL